MLVSIGRKYGNIMSIDLNHLYLVIYILWSLNMKIINLKPQLVEVLRFLTFLCFFMDMLGYSIRHYSFPN